MRSALIPILLNSVPGWVRNAYPADVLPSLSLAAHYDQDLYWMRGRGQCSITDIQTCTRAQTVPSYATMASGLLVPFAANTNRRTDFGVSSEEARTNILLQSNAFTTTWNKAGTTTFTANSGTDPTGGNNAWQWAGSANFSYFNQAASGGTTSGSTYVAQLWLKPGTLGQVRLQFGSIDGNNTASAIFNALTGAAVSHTTAGTGVYVNSGSTIYSNGWILIWVAGSYTGTAGGMIVDNPSGTGNCMFWQADVQLGAFPTSPIPTTTVPVARAADNIASTVPWLTTNIGFMFASVGGAAAIGGVIFNTHNSTETDPIYAKTSTTIATYINGDKAVATLGSGTISGAGKYAVGFDGSGHSLVGNNGTVATNVGTFNNTSTLIIGSVAGSSSFYNGPIKRIALGQARPSDAVLKALTA